MKPRDPVAKIDSWASYFYPPPDHTKMRNFDGIRDFEALTVKENGEETARYIELYENLEIVE